MQDGHTFADTIKNNDIIEAFYTCEKSGLLVKKCIQLWKPVKLIVGVYVMVKISETDDWNVFDAALPVIDRSPI